MCLVSFLPTSTGGFILTSNRDEQVSRQRAVLPRRYSVGRRTVFYPKDGRAGGTWIATDEHQHTLCLLNGAFEAHQHQPPYRHSRGRVIPDFLPMKMKLTF